MRKLMFVATLVLVGAAQSAMATSDKSDSTKFIESMSSSSYSKVECSMEDHTCQKLIMDMGRQEALNRVLSGDKGAMSVVLQQSVTLVRTQNATETANMSDEQIVNILAQQPQQ